MKTTLLLTGKTDEVHFRDAMAVYEKRLKHYLDLKVAELPAAKGLSPEQQKTKEGQQLLKQLAPSDVLVLLDEKGKEYSSEGFADFMQQQLNRSTRHLVFATGGAHGFSKEVYDRANAQLSLSKMTLPHQLARVVFAEQLYRAMTILKNESYHHR